MRIRIIPLTLCLLASSLPLRAEEETPGEPPAPPVVRAFTHWLDRPVIAFEGRVEREEAPSGMGGLGGGIVLGAGGAQAEPFAGVFEAYADEDESALASSETLPAFAVLSNADGVVTRLTFEDQPWDIEEVRGDVLALLDRHRLRRWIPKASWQALSPRRYRAEVDRRLLPSPPRSNPVAPPARNLRIRMEVELDAEGALAAFDVVVERNDPTQAMAMRLLREQGGLPGGVQLPEGAGADADATASVVRYALRIEPRAPTRVRETAAALRADLGQDDVVTAPGR